MYLYQSIFKKFSQSAKCLFKSAFFNMLFLAETRLCLCFLELRFMQSFIFLGSECSLRSRAGLKGTPKGGEGAVNST